MFVGLVDLHTLLHSLHLHPSFCTRSALGQSRISPQALESLIRLSHNSIVVKRLWIFLFDFISIIFSPSPIEPLLKNVILPLNKKCNNLKTPILSVDVVVVVVVNVAVAVACTSTICLAISSSFYPSC